jgi:hypothetical protein
MPKTELNQFQNALSEKRVKARRTHAEPFARVDYQIRQASLGRLASLVCPYCSSNVMLGVEKLCCVPMGEAVDAVLRRMEPEDLLETGALTDYQSRPRLIADVVKVAMGFGASTFVQ